MRTRFPALLFCAALCCSLVAGPRPQDSGSDGGDRDRFVRLMSAQSVRLLEIDGKTFRKAEGPARFFHNNTWLICDTALWSVDDHVIYAIGHVAIQQEETELTSDRLTYFSERNVAEFRGTLVQLKDKDNNTLRTRNLDYNTKDSVAIFRSGGSMRDKDGQIMESVNGTYDSKAKVFTFDREVEMFTDSVFIKTESLLYESDKSLATFNSPLYAWKDDNMLAADSGWYDRSRELFLFTGKVHMMSPTQEGWSDTLYYDRGVTNLTMLGNAQVTDQERRVSALGGRIHYVDSLKQVYLQRNPLVMMATEDEKTGVVDTVYFGADDILYWTERHDRINQEVMAAAQARLAYLDTDPISNFRQKAAEEAQKKIDEAMKNDPNYVAAQRAMEIQNGTGGNEEGQDPAAQNGGAAQNGDNPPPVPGDSPNLNGDGAPPAPADSLAQVSAPEVPVDTSDVGFLRAVRNVKVYRTDMQMKCDSLLYCDLDSMARLYIDPYVWNERGSHQYTADSIYVKIQGQKVDKAYLMANSFIHVEEVRDKYYDQIRATEMTAYFDKDAELRRFDAMGGVNAMFFLMEDGRYQTVNKSEATLLSADFNAGQLRRLTYYESPKSDVFPIAQMLRSEMFLKGYHWKPELRPTSRYSISKLRSKASQRAKYDDVEHCIFLYTNMYFPGYMEGIYSAIAEADARAEERAREREILMSGDAASSVVPPVSATVPAALSDSLSASADSVSVVSADTALAATAPDTAEEASAAATTAPVGSAVPESSEIPAADLADATTEATAAVDAAATALTAAAAGASTAAASAAAAEAAVSSNASAAATFVSSAEGVGTAAATAPEATNPADSLSSTDSLTESQRAKLEKLALLEAARLAKKAASDSVKAVRKAEADSARAVADSLRAIRLAARDSVWALKDQADWDKAAAKQAKKDARKEYRIRVTQQKMMRQKMKEDAALEKYRQRYRKRSKILKNTMP